MRLVAIVSSWILCSLNAAGQSTWNGNTSNDWTAVANWSSGVPNASRAAVIPPGTPNSPSTVNAGLGAFCSALTVQTGAQLEIPAGTRLSCNGTLQILGACTGTGTLRVIGVGANLSSPSTPIAPQVVIEGNSGAAFSLSADFLCGASFTLLSGNFVDSTNRLIVQGNASFQGGTLNLRGSRSTVHGNVDFAGTTPSGAVDLEVRGDFSANAAFAPTSGTIFFARAGTQSVSGTFPAFQECRIEAGSTVNAAGNIAVRGLLTVAGTLNASAGLDVNGTVNVPGGGTLSLGAGPNRFGGSFTIAGNLVAGGTLIFDGGGSLSIRAGLILPAVRIESTSSFACVSPVTVGGDFALVTGDFSDQAFQLVVQGNALFQGGTLNLRASRSAVHGNVTFAGTAPSGSVDLEVRGAFSANAAFAPTSGTIFFARAGTQSVSGSFPAFQECRIEAGSTVNAAGNIGVRGQLTVAGTLNASASLDVNGTVNVLGSGTLSLGAGPNRFGGSFIVAGNLVGGGTLIFDGGGTLSTRAGLILPALRIEATSSFACASPVTVGSDFTQVAGNFDDAGNQLVVQGNALFQGGTVNLRAARSTVHGNVNFAGATPNGGITLEVRGDFSADAAFAPAGGTIFLSRAGTQSVSGSFPHFHGCRIEAGTAVNVASNLRVRDQLSVAGTLQVSASLDVDGILNVTSSGTLNLGAGTHRFGGSFTVAGNLSGSGTLIFDGASNLDVRAGLVLPRIRIESASSVSCFSSVTVGGDFALVSGNFSDGGSPLNVQGNALLDGGTANFQSTSTTVRGDVRVTGTLPNGGFSLAIEGDYSAPASFAPTAGRIAFIGTGDHVLASLDPSGQLRFAGLEFNGGRAFATSDAHWTASSIAIGAQGTLDTAGHRLRLEAAGALPVSGVLEVDAAAEMLLDPRLDVAIGASGTLRLLGTAAQPAVVRGAPTNGYGFSIAGRIEAQNFVFEDMDQAGIQVAASAAFAPAPLDFRAGSFARGATQPGAVLLDVARTAPLDLQRLTFTNQGTATFNVRTRTGAPIRMLNWRGSFSGEGFEDDPGSRIEWVVPLPTLLTSFRADGRCGRIDLSFATTREVEDLALFRILRATNAAGPFTELAGSPITPRGSPTSGASYELIDGTASFPTKFFYQLQEELTHGERAVLATDFARASSFQHNRAVWVGPSSPFRDIASGIAAAPNGGIVLVEEGTYAAFTWSKAVRIVADGTGPVRIDTSGAPLVLRDLGINQPDAGLYDLEIVGSAGNGQGLHVINCDAIVVLDHLTIQTAANVDALRIDDCPRVSVQACALQGGGLRARNASTCYIGRGAMSRLDVESSSHVTHAGVVPGATQAQASARVDALSGTMPWLFFPAVIASEKPVPFAMEGDPGTLIALYIGDAGKIFADLSSVIPVDMVMLMDLPNETFAGAVTLPASGRFTMPVLVPPDPLMFGNFVPVQAVTFNSALQRGRFTNVRDLVVVP